MFKHLLVPLDGSELSEKALAVARSLLATHGEITLLNVVDLPENNLALLYDMPMLAARINTQELLTTAQQNARNYLLRVAEGLHLPSTVVVKIEVCVGEAASTITERAHALHVDAIVMSTHGRSGLSRWVFGSVTQRVVSLMPCPVLIVPGQPHIPVQQPPVDAVGAAS